jgi:hypothetical protein
MKKVKKKPVKSNAMKQFFAALLEYIKKMHSFDPEVSSKRIYGGIIIITILIWAISKGNVEVITTMAIIGAGLLGMEAIERIARGKGGNNDIPG